MAGTIQASTSPKSFFLPGDGSLRFQGQQQPARQMAFHTLQAVSGSLGPDRSSVLGLYGLQCPNTGSSSRDCGAWLAALCVNTLGIAEFRDLLRCAEGAVAVLKQTSSTSPRVRSTVIHAFYEQHQLGTAWLWRKQPSVFAQFGGTTRHLRCELQKQAVPNHCYYM